MPRINIEDKWFLDPRRDVLISLLNGDSEKADGAAIAAWRLAQPFFIKGERIPKQRFNLLKSSQALIDSQLAVVEGDEVRVCGAHEHFRWIHEKAEASRIAGKASAEARKKKYGSAQPNQEKEEEIEEETPNEDRTGVRESLDSFDERLNEVERSYSSSSSCSPSSSSSVSNSDSSSKNILGKKKGKRQPGIRTEYPDEFETLWKLYGMKGDKKESYEEYLKLNLSLDEREQLSNAIPIYFKTLSEKKYRKDFQRFLNRDWRQHLVSRTEVVNLDDYSRKSETALRNERNNAWLQEQLRKAAEQKSQQGGN